MFFARVSLIHELCNILLTKKLWKNLAFELHVLQEVHRGIEKG